MSQIDRSAAGAADARVWRVQLLDVLLRTVFVLGAIVAVPSAGYAASIGSWGVIAADLTALTVIGVLNFRRSLSFHTRAIGLLATTFALGVFLFTVVGPVAGMYLIAVPVLAATLLGTRAAVIALVINGATMVALGMIPGLEPAIEDETINSFASWLTVTVNFMFVNAFITLSCAAIIGRLERSLRLNRRMAVAVEQSTNGIMISEPDGVVVYANSTAEHFLGFRGGDDGITLASLLQDAEPSVPDEFPAEGWNGMVTRGATADRSLQVFAVTVRFARSDDDDLQLVTVLRDITTDLELQGEIGRSEKLQALGTLVGGTAHDFNNALSSVVGLSQLLRSELDDPEHLSMVDDILLASERARGVVRQLMLFGQQSRAPRSISNLSQRLEGDLPIFRASIANHLHLELDAEPDVMASIDWSEMHHAVANLVTNAAHSMVDRPSGTITLRLRSIATADGPFDDDELRAVGPVAAHLAVLDTGSGIDLAIIPRVFDPFFTTKPADQGTGLGLAIVHGTITAAGGHVTIDSIVGVGTSVNVYLPAEVWQTQPDGAPTPTDMATSEVGGPEPRGWRLLVVDDEQMILSSIGRLLERRGYDVTALGDPTLVETVLDSDSRGFDLVITDVSMPTMSGIDVARVVRNHRHDLPIVLMSGYGDSVPAEVRTELGLDVMIDKPFTIDDLCACITATVGATPAT